MLRLCRRCFALLSNRRLSLSAGSKPDTGVLRLSDEVASALHAGKAVVALETTIITHGMPYPDNLRMAGEVEGIVRASGAVPAPIGVLQGRIHVGLSRQQLEFLADPNTKTVKTSRRDLPIVTSQKLNGGTTVAGTMAIANQAGIQVFATGGVGGVHRGAETSMDISADLTELSRTPVAVVSSGVKSILDIGRTLEYLETMGVCVVSFGPSREFPAFFTRNSGYQSPHHVTTATEAAAMIDSGRKLGLQTGILIGVPIPSGFAAEGDNIEAAVQSAVMDAGRRGLHGQEVTPFILQRVNEITEGKSLTSNIHLVKNNARVASEIAVELASLKRGHLESGSQDTTTTVRRRRDTKSQAGTQHERRVAVVGGSIVDFYVRLKARECQLKGATYPGYVQQSFGGVGRNLADALSRLGTRTLFISAIGEDSHSAAFEAYCNHMDLSGVARLKGAATATYCGVLTHTGDLMFGVGDMDIHAKITPQYICQFEEDLSQMSLVCVDGNVSDEAILCVTELCSRHRVPVWYEPADVHKAKKPFVTGADKGLTYTSPNLNELRAMVAAVTGREVQTTGVSDDSDLASVLKECALILPVVAEIVPVVMVSLGKHGLVLCHHGNMKAKLPLKGDSVKTGGGLVMEHYPATPTSGKPSSIVSVSGAGDCLAAAMVTGLVRGQATETCVKAGLHAAQLSLQSAMAVPPTLSCDLVSEDKVREWMPLGPTKLGPV